MTKDQLMTEAQDFIATQLERSGEFGKIEIGYRFDSSLDSRLNEQTKRFVYAEKKTASSNYTPKYLIVVNAELPSDRIDPLGLLEAASKNGIYAMHVQYKGRDSDFFNWAGSVSSKARRLIPEDEKKRQIKTNLHERLLNERLENVLYFNPSEKRLEVIQFLDATPPNYDYLKPSAKLVQSRIDMIKRRETKSYKTIKDHRVIAAFPEFSLGSYSKNSLDLATPLELNTLESRMACLLALEDAAARNKQSTPSEEVMCHRIMNLLHSCSVYELKDLAKRFGEKALGTYSIKVANQ